MTTLKPTKKNESEFIAECVRRGLNPKTQVNEALKFWIEDSRQVAVLSKAEKKSILAAFTATSHRHKVLKFLLDNNPTNSLALKKEFGKGYSGITSANHRLASHGLIIDCQKVSNSDFLKSQYHGLVYSWKIVRLAEQKKVAERKLR